MADSILDLQDLYNEALVREVIEKTKSCGLTWNSLGGTQYQATEVQSNSPDPDVTWNFFITKTQIGNSTYKFTLDVKKDAVAYITVQDGPLPYTARDSVVMDLYNIVETIVLELDSKLKETIRFIQGITDCHS
jgi:hypothetical protein